MTEYQLWARLPKEHEASSWVLVDFFKSPQAARDDIDENWAEHRRQGGIYRIVAVQVESMRNAPTEFIRKSV